MLTRMPLVALPLSLTLMMSTAWAQADTGDDAAVLGAASVIEQLSGDRPDAGAVVNERDPVAKALASAQAKGLTPEEQGERWHGALAAYLKSPQRTDKSLQEIMAAIPGPDAWPTIIERIDAQPEQTRPADRAKRAAVRLLAAGLAGDADLQRERAEALDEAVSKLPRARRQWMQERVAEVASSLEDQPPEAQEVVARLAQRVAQAKSEGGHGQTPEASVPDLVKLIGRDKAEPVLRSLLKEPVLLEVEGDETRELARSLALEMVNELKVAQWHLAQSLDASELYEALDRRFSDGEAARSEARPPAPGAVGGGLLGADDVDPRVEEAMKEALGVGTGDGDGSGTYLIGSERDEKVEVRVEVEQGVDAEALPSAGETMEATAEAGAAEDGEVTLDEVESVEVDDNIEMDLPVADGNAERSGGGGGGVVRMFRRMMGASEVDVEVGESRDWTVNYAKASADRYYLAGLIADGRTEAAAAMLKRQARAVDLEEDEDAAAFELPYDVLTRLDRAGFSDQVFKFLHQMLQEDPDLPVWSAYVSLATRTGHTGEMVELAEASLKREGLLPSHRLRIQRQLAEGLLAADRVEEGLAAMRQTAVLADDARENGEGSRDAQTLFNTGVTLARLGRALDRAELIDEGVALAERAMKAPGPDGGYSASYRRNSLAELLADVGREARAEAMLVDSLREATVPPTRDRWGNVERGGGDPTQPLIELAGLYHAMDRHDDVLKLLNDAPWWSADDLADLYIQTDARRTPLGLMAAAALHADGQEQQALDVLIPTLREFDGNDDAYALLLDLAEPERAQKVLEGIAGRDRFEERPLIWLAQLHLRQGAMAEAEDLIKRAIAVDPSDGEQGRGDRMRAYAVYADVLEKKGDAKQAKFYRDVVESIRMSEDADRLYAAGLITRAVALYEKALTRFADAYCIQSRLAIRLAQMGQIEKASEHYRKAFELMPDSFGRVESHCFGCEGAFSGQLAQDIAERTFSAMVQSRPDKPQVWYLLGYLRASQDRDREALENFKRAVQLDPDYLNAWERVAGLAESPRLRDEAALNLLRLDPTGEHTRADLSAVTDLPALWRAVAEATATAPEAPKRLMTLDAAAERREQGDADEMEAMVRVHRYRGTWNEDESQTPGTTLASHRYVQLLEQVLMAAQ